jgi:lysozyme family protein
VKLEPFFMMGEFERALAKVLVHEGGYVNHPKDPGGATNFGITQGVYDDYRKTVGQKPQPVKAITRPERDSIYRARYWSLVKGDSLPAGIAYVVFDGAVNSGVGQSAKWLQRALGVPADGVIGPQTIIAARAHDNHDALVRKICDLRAAFYRALKTFKTFGKGWLRRLDDVRAVGQAWAMGDTGPEIAYVPGGEAKARLADAKSALITQATDQLTPMVNIEFVANIVAALTVAGVVVSISGLAYRVWADRKAKRLELALS